MISDDELDRLEARALSASSSAIRPPKADTRAKIRRHLQMLEAEEAKKDG